MKLGKKVKKKATTKKQKQNPKHILSATDLCIQAYCIDYIWIKAMHQCTLI